MAFVNAAFIGVAGCGGGGGGAPAASTTTNVTSTVIDGAIRNALVCVDKNANGICDPGETQGRTDAAGNVTMAVPNSDLGLYPILAVVGTDAVDVDNGPVTVAYTLAAPAGRPAVVSPLTNLVYQNMQFGATLAEAEASVKDLTGITVSLFEDFTRAPAPTDGSPKAADVARMVVVTTQAQSTALAPAMGMTATDGSTISRADLDKAVQQKLLELLPALVTALADPATAALTGTAREAAVVAALNSALTTPAQVATTVAINNQQARDAAVPVVAYVPGSGINLDTLFYTDANNWSSRVLGGSLAQNTLDANGFIRVFDRRNRANNGVIANWNFGTNPQDQSDLHWTGSAWSTCALNFEFTATLRDARGNNEFNYCNNYTAGKSIRTAFNVGGRTMLSVYNEVIAAGYTNWSIANAATVLGTTVFPADSKLYYQATTTLQAAFAYYPGTNSVATKNVQSTGLAAVCNVAAPPNTAVTTLEDLATTFRGTPCTFGNDSIVNVNGTFTSDVPNTGWGNTTLGLSTVGTAPVVATPSSYFTGNALIRMAFTAGAPNEVTYYTCKQRQVNGGTRSCVAIGAKGAYSIQTLPDGARVMTFTNLPAQTSVLTTNRVFVERNGAVYFGFQPKKGVTNVARLNDQASDALFVKLGMPAIDPEVPLALTGASYQGTWDITDPANPPGNGATIVLNANGTQQCNDRPTGVAFSCTFNFTNPATGALSGLNNTNGSVIAGTLNFMTGTGSGTYSGPPPGTFVATRR